MDGQPQNSPSDHLINILLNDGLSEGLVTIAQTLMNAAMLIERERHLGVAPHQHSTERNGHANGFKPRKFQTSMGQLDLAVPQVRGSSEPFRRENSERKFPRENSKRFGEKIPDDLRENSRRFARNVATRAKADCLPPGVHGRGLSEWAQIGQ
jgi:transposase-like protein